MFIKNLSKREKALVYIIILLAAIAIVYSLVVEHIVLRRRTLNNQIESKRAMLVRNTRLLGMYGALEAEYAKYHDIMEVSKNEEEELATALAEIENISRRSSAYIANLKPRAVRKLGNYKEISFEVTAEGTIDELSKFLYEIETSRAYLRAKRFTITTKSSPSGGLKATFLVSKIIVT